MAEQEEAILSFNVEEEPYGFMKFIHGLRQALGETWFQNLPVLKPEQKETTVREPVSDWWFPVRLSTNHYGGIFQVRKENAYVDAYLYPHMLRYVEFKGTSVFKDSDHLNFTGSYLDLASVCGKKFYEIEFSMYKVKQAINELGKEGIDDRTRAFSLTIIIVFVIESARLATVFDKFKNPEFYGPLTGHMTYMVRNWKKYSKYLQKNKKKTETDEYRDRRISRFQSALAEIRLVKYCHTKSKEDSETRSTTKKKEKHKHSDGKAKAESSRSEGKTGKKEKDTCDKKEKSSSSKPTKGKQKSAGIYSLDKSEVSYSQSAAKTIQTKRRKQSVSSFEATDSPTRNGSEAWDNRHRAALPGTTSPIAQDEESEPLLGRIFNDFLQSGQVDGSLAKLQNAGAFDRDGYTNIFARTSKSIVDTLANHWTTTRGDETVCTKLRDKQQKHNQFLRFLAISSCHEELSSRVQTKSLQIIMEHGEKLAGMIQLRELQNMTNQNRSLSTLFVKSESEMSGSLWDLIQLVGEQARRNFVLLMDRYNAEVFYSKVSNIEDIFSCLDRELEYLINAESPLTVQINRSCELSNACVTLLRTAIQYRNVHQIWYPAPEGITPWYCQSVVRNGIWKITSFMLRLLKETSATDMSTKSELYSILEILAEVLLDAFNGAIRAKVDRGEDHGSLLEEYCTKKDALFGSLYEQVKSLAEAKRQQLNEGEILGNLSSGLLSIAKQHEGYQTMWNICCDLNDSILLRTLMHESTGTKGGFSYYVLTQMYETRQFAKLLRLKEEFQEELSTFIKQHNDLIWLHQFSSSLDTLHPLSVSQDDNAKSMMEEGDAPTINNPEQTMTRSKRKRFLNLSKTAAMAGKDAIYETKVKRVKADLKLVKEEITKSICEDEMKQNIGQRLPSPEDLIKLYPKDQNPELSLQASEVFPWTDAFFSECNKAPLERTMLENSMKLL